MAAAWLFYTGCRVGEAINAQQRDVRLIRERGLYQWSIPDTKTHLPRNVWLPESLAHYVEQSRATNSPRADWPILWDCEGRGFSRVENPAASITAKTINAALDRAAARVGILVKVTAHTAKHTYCTNWITDQGDAENSMERLSRQVGTSVAVLRRPTSTSSFQTQTGNTFANSDRGSTDESPSTIAQTSQGRWHLYVRLRN